VWCSELCGVVSSEVYGAVGVCVVCWGVRVVSVPTSIATHKNNANMFRWVECVCVWFV
jgi:hypothetical protein